MVWLWLWTLNIKIFLWWVERNLFSHSFSTKHITSSSRNYSGVRSKNCTLRIKQLIPLFFEENIKRGEKNHRKQLSQVVCAGADGLSSSPIGPHFQTPDQKQDSQFERLRNFISFGLIFVFPPWRCQLHGMPFVSRFDFFMFSWYFRQIRVFVCLNGRNYMNR